MSAFFHRKHLMKSFRQCNCVSVTIILLAAFSSTPGLALGSKLPVTWLKSVDELPQEVRAALSTCGFFSDDTGISTEYKNIEYTRGGETGGFHVKLDDLSELYMTNCDAGASDFFDAAVLYKDHKATRLNFTGRRKDGTVYESDTAGNTQWLGDGAVSSSESHMCDFGHYFENFYRLKDSKFVNFVPDTDQSLCPHQENENTQ